MLQSENMNVMLLQVVEVDGIICRIFPDSMLLLVDRCICL